MEYNFSKSFDHLKSDKVMAFLIDKFGDKISLNDRYDLDYAKAISNLIIEPKYYFNISPKETLPYWAWRKKIFLDLAEGEGSFIGDSRIFIFTIGLISQIVWIVSSI